MGQVLVKAFKDPSYTLIFLGFFSCGYQLAFITAHFPAFVTELCGPIDPGGMLGTIGITTTSALGAVSIAVIGLFNIVGTVTAGWLGKRYSKKYLLAGIYTGRTDCGGGVHLAADHADLGAGVFRRHGRAVAGDGAADIGSGRAYLRHPLYGHAVWLCVPEPPDRRVPGRLAGRRRCTT